MYNYGKKEYIQLKNIFRKELVHQGYYLQGRKLDLELINMILDGFRDLKEAEYYLAYGIKEPDNILYYTAQGYAITTKILKFTIQIAKSFKHQKAL